MVQIALNFTARLFAGDAELLNPLILYGTHGENTAKRSGVLPYSNWAKLVRSP